MLPRNKMATHSLTYPFQSPPAPGSALEVAPGLLWLRMPLPFALDHINLWLVKETTGWSAIDTGFSNEPTRSLWQECFAEVLDHQPLQRVIATHCHPDHLGNATWLTERFAVPLWMTQGEYLSAHAMHDESAGYGIATLVHLFQQHGLAATHCDLLQQRGNAYRRGVPAIPMHYHRFLPEDHIILGDVEWQVIPGYGHSPEHAALYCPSKQVLISGDMLLPKISTNVSVWPIDPDGDPLALFLASIDRFARLPKNTLVLPSHGLPFVGIAERIAQLNAHHEARLVEVRAALTKPLTAAQIVPVLFRRELDTHQMFFAMGEAIAHLNHLYHQHAITRSQQSDGSITFGRF